jgi:hypothetical protein
MMINLVPYLRPKIACQLFKLHVRYPLVGSIIDTCGDLQPLTMTSFLTNDSSNSFLLEYDAINQSVPINPIGITECNWSARMGQLSNQAMPSDTDDIINPRKSMMMSFYTSY